LICCASIGVHVGVWAWNVNESRNKKGLKGHKKPGKNIKKAE